ncbi:MAG: MMPL family transporter [Thermoplasmata archaeon]
MLEKQFKIYSNSIIKYSKIVIIIWIIFTLLMLPFSNLLFKETSYDISSSVIPKNSMEYQASHIYAQEFPSQNSNVSANIILIENASLNDTKNIKLIWKLTNELENNSIIKKYDGNISDILIVERDIIKEGTNYTYKIYNSTSILLKNIKNSFNILYNYTLEIKNYEIFIYNAEKNIYENITNLINITNKTLLLEFGLPSYYVHVFLYVYDKTKNINISNEYALKYTINFIENNISIMKTFLISYIYNFSKIWNYSLTNVSQYLNVEEYSIGITIYNSSFSSFYVNNNTLRFFDILYKYFNVTNFQNSTLILKFSLNYIINNLENTELKRYLPVSVRDFVLETYNSSASLNLTLNITREFLGNNYTRLENIYGSNFTYSIFNLSNVYNFTYNKYLNYIKSNGTLINFTSFLNINIEDLLKFSLNGSIYYNSANITYNWAKNYFNGYPFLNIQTSLRDYILKYNYTDIDELENETFLNGNFSSYPFIPGPYVYHSFVGYKYNVSMILITTNDSAPVNLTYTIGNIAKKVLGDNLEYLIAGSAAMESQLTSDTNLGLLRALFIGIIVSLLISIIFFRSPVAGILPLTIFGMSAIDGMGINGILYKYVLNSQISFITPTLLLILLLGLSTDYTVYMLSRYRNELRKGNEKPSETMTEWSGHAIFTSGLTVILSYITLWLFDVPLFGDSGLTNAISITITVIMALTLIPSITYLLNKRMFWPSKIDSHKNEIIMEKIYHVDRKYYKHLIIIFIILVVIGLIFYISIPTNMDVFDLVPHQSGINAVIAINNSFGGDAVFQNYIILKFNNTILKDGKIDKYAINVSNNLENYLLQSKNVSMVFGLGHPFGNYELYKNSSILANETFEKYRLNYVGIDNKTILIIYRSSIISWDNREVMYTGYLDKSLKNIIPSNITYYVGGLSQGLYDAQIHTNDAFYSIIPILTVAAFFILLIQFNSIFTPLRLILMVLGSVLISLSISYVIFYFIMKMPILVLLPLFVFVTLLAVGLDYDIFMITRVREEVMKGKDDSEGIHTSLKENGYVISILGLILFSTFASLYFSSIGIIQEIGVGLGLGVIIDTYISWMFFIPSVMLWMKRYNWWPSEYKKF